MPLPTSPFPQEPQGRPQRTSPPPSGGGLPAFEDTFEDAFEDAFDEEPVEQAPPPRRQAPARPQRPQRQAPPPPPVEEDDPFSDISLDDDSLYEEEEESDSFFSEKIYDAGESSSVFDEEDHEEEAPPPRSSRQASSRERPSREAPARGRREASSRPAPEKSSREAPSRGKREAPARPEKPSREAPARRGRKKTSEKPTRGGGASRATEDTFIDEENLKLKPFGRKPPSVRDGEFDKRENLRKKAAAVRGIFLALVALLVLLGIKNAVIPPKTLSEAEVTQIVATNAGDTGFPLERGRAFATDFMAAYMTVNSDAYASRALSYFYSGKFDGGENSELPRSVNSDFKQTIVYGPTVYSSKALTPASASYTIGALVDVSEQAERNEVSSGTNDGTKARWSFFSVSVFYDKKTDSFRIGPKSPIVVPSPEVGGKVTLPKPKPLGTGKVDSALTEEITPTIQGYIKAFAISSPNNHAALDQYITDPTKIALTKGMGGRYTIEGSENSAIKTAAYPSSTPGKVFAETTVIWTDKITPEQEASTTFTASYIITLEKQSNGKYLVSAISPNTYRPDVSTDSTSEETAQ